MPLQKSILNRDIPRLFVAATRQNDGKTTTCLGLYGVLRRAFERVGYIKPMGQRYVDLAGRKVDEDTILFDRFFHVDAPIEAMSPVVIDGSFTRRFLDDPDQLHRELVDKLVRAFDRASYEKDAVIIEGSGHAGVGAVCDLSNAQVAKLFGAKAIIVAKGGIGQPVDEISLNKSHFDQHGVEVLGVILNKCIPTKLEMVRSYAGKALSRLGVPLLGVVPESRPLSTPSLAQVVAAVRGRWLNGQRQAARVRVRQIVVGAMAARGIIDFLRPGVLVITPGDRDDILLAALAGGPGMTPGQRIAGIILTRGLLPHPKLMALLAEAKIPVVACADDSYTVASQINSLTVKTQPEDEDKIDLIQELIATHVDIEQVCAPFGVTIPPVAWAAPEPTVAAAPPVRPVYSAK